MATLRRRPTAHRAHSDLDPLLSAANEHFSSSPTSDFETEDSATDTDAPLPPRSSPRRRPPPRPRARSLHDSPLLSSHHFPRTHAALSYGSQLLESLDLPGSLGGVREYLRGRVEEAERGLRRLREMMEQDEEDEVEDGEQVRGRSAATSTSSSRAVSPSGGDENDAEFATLEDDLSTLESFVSSASSFLSALRAELPSLSLSPSSSPSSPMVALHLSPDARAALDRFLAAHPLPSLPSLPTPSMPHYGVRAAVVARVSVELDTLRAAMAHLTSPSPAASPGAEHPGPLLEGMASYLPTPPALPDLAAVRSYFAEESSRLSSSLSHLTSDASTSLSHLGGEIKHAASEAMDEVSRMYHAAVEAGKTRLLRYEELPVEWRNNQHVVDGYRYIPIESWGRLLRSGWEWHNETVNIQSHFLGFLSLVCLLVYHLCLSPTSPHGLSNPHKGDTAIAVLFVLSAMHCLLCSAAWHLFAGCASSRWFRGAACVDYVGISGLIAASVMGAEYYGFYTRPVLATSYMVFSAAVGVAGMVVPWRPWFNMREFKMWRIAFFCSLAASAVMPIAHRSVVEGWRETMWFYSPAIPSVLAYLVGLVFYSNQFPECCRPGSWHLGASHQVWHISIVAAIYLHWRAMSSWSTTVALAELAGVDPAAALGAH
ncbi:hypothetical protein JCM8097_000398 [Rhodosporidiobolus ruineniae]